MVKAVLQALLSGWVFSLSAVVFTAVCFSLFGNHLFPGPHYYEFAVTQTVFLIGGGVVGFVVGLFFPSCYQRLIRTRSD